MILSIILYLFDTKDKLIYRKLIWCTHYLRKSELKYLTNKKGKRIAVHQIIEKVKELEPTRIEQMLDLIAFLKHKNSRQPYPQFSSGKGVFEMMLDFDDPLDDVKECL